jgi:drug/metabolite transporter (DMT)-like permease
MPTTRSPRTGIVFAFLCLGILGVMPVLAAARPAGADGLAFAIWLTGWQLVAALPLYAIEARRSGRALALPRQDRLRTGLVALATGAMFGFATYAYIVAASKAGPVGMAIALQAYPLFAILWEGLFLGKRKSPAELVCTAVMIAALVYLTTGGTFRVSGMSWWFAFALIIPLLWSIAHLLLKRIIETAPVTPNQITVSRLAISGICLLLLHAVAGQEGALAAGLRDAEFQKAAAVLGVAYTVELVLWFHAMRHIDVSLGSSITVPAPAVTMVVTVMVLGQKVETYQIVAMVVVVAAMYGLVLAGRLAAARRP